MNMLFEVNEEGQMTMIFEGDEIQSSFFEETVQV
jgi:Cu/Ag efflux protein CusF